MNNRPTFQTRDYRVVMLTPAARDARLIARALADHGLVGRTVGDVEHLCETLGEPAGCIVLAEEVLDDQAVAALASALTAQPLGTDLPLVVLVSPAGGAGAHLRRLLARQTPTRVTLLERPLRAPALLAVVRTALRVRQQQYDALERLHRHQEAERILRRAQAVARVGDWRLDIRREVLTWSQETYRIFGIPAGTPLTYERFLQTVHPDDLALVDNRWKACLPGEPYELEHRIVVDGAVRWVRARAYMEIDEAGEVLGEFGIVQDITDLKPAEEALRRLSQFPEENLNPVLRVTLDGGLLYANPPARCWLAALGWTPDGSLPAVVRDIVADVHECRGVVEVEIGDTRGLTLWVSAVQPPDETYVNLYGRDVTQRKAAEQRLEQARDELEQRVA